MHSGSSSDKAKVTVPAVPVTQLCSTMPLQKNFYFTKPDGDDLRNFTVRPWLFFIFYFTALISQAEVPDKLFLGISNSAKLGNSFPRLHLFVLPAFIRTVSL
jgi:hypothetical protein